MKGTDGNPGCPADGSGTPWTLTAKVEGEDIFVDFSPKGGPKDLKGVFDGTGINWPDGKKKIVVLCGPLIIAEWLYISFEPVFRKQVGSQGRIDDKQNEKQVVQSYIDTHTQRTAIHSSCP
jgi:hypothetical protein